MNKQTIITCLRGLLILVLALVAVTGQAKSFKTIKAAVERGQSQACLDYAECEQARTKFKKPVAMDCVNVSNGELKACKVIFRDTATTVHFTMEYEKGNHFRFAIPDTPMADLIRRLCEKYPGKILIIDFWDMGCGPCRSAIQSSKQKRAEIAKRDDVKLIFIAGERTTEGSDAYKKYVAEWMADEETICITNADFNRLQELFRFNGIPHYETITPDCHRVRDDLQIQGFFNFDNELQILLEKLK